MVFQLFPIKLFFFWLFLHFIIQSQSIRRLIYKPKIKKLCQYWVLKLFTSFFHYFCIPICTKASFVTHIRLLTNNEKYYWRNEGLMLTKHCTIQTQNWEKVINPHLWRDVTYLYVFCNEKSISDHGTKYWKLLLLPTVLKLIKPFKNFIVDITIQKLQNYSGTIIFYEYKVRNVMLFILW